MTYIRWGRSDCPNAATVLYEGFVGGAWFSVGGGTSSFICLPDEPEYVQTEECYDCSLVSSAEYETRNQVFPSETYQYDAVCVSCLALEKTTIVMMPGKTSCPSSFQTEYSGYLMSTYPSFNHATDAICVDGNAESMLGSHEDHNGAALYFVAADCSSSFIPCGPYKHRIPISCVVCSY